jgi:hypothetical protein
VFRKQVFDPNHLYKMSRHFVWLIPLSNVFVFVALALLGGSIMGRTIVLNSAKPRSPNAHVLPSYCFTPTVQHAE